MTGRLIKITTAPAVVAVAGVAAIISYQHAYELADVAEGFLDAPGVEGPDALVDRECLL